MKYFLIILFLLPKILLALDPLYAPAISPKKAWDHITKLPYDENDLPLYKVRYKDFFSYFGENLILKDSKRTVQSRNHFIPPKRKLLFPMGICLKGEWQIDEHSHDYTGYFKSGTRGFIIARASTSLSRPFYKQYRNLAISGKVFPTKNSQDLNPLNAANFLLMRDNGGKKNEYFTEAYLTNAAPAKFNFAALPLLRIALTVGKAFNNADTRRDIRQLYQIAELGTKAPFSSPRWMVLRGTNKMQELSHKLQESDFRSEIIELLKKNKTIDLEIFVASNLENKQPIYSKIGKIVFDDYAATKMCDESLHFQHPPYIKQYATPELNQKPHKNSTLNN